MKTSSKYKSQVEKIKSQTKVRQNKSYLGASAPKKTRGEDNRFGNISAAANALTHGN